MSDQPHIVVSGATGYVGRALVRAAVREGVVVSALARQCPAWLGAMPVTFAAYELSGPVPACGRVDAIVHLAADTRDEALIDDLSEDAEVAAAVSMLEFAGEGGARFVFASSPSAAPDAPSRYGRVKWRIEQIVAERGGLVVRLGLVYGGRDPAGLYARLVDIVTHAPVLPALIPSPRVQPVFIGDLCRALLALSVDRAIGPGLYAVADPEPVPFTRFLQTIARQRVRRRRVFLPIPAALVAAIAKLGGALGAPGIPADRILSLIAAQPVNSRPTLEAIGLTLTALEDGMHATGSAQRRRLAGEGQALLRYVTGRIPPAGLVRRYVRALEALGETAPLAVPAVAIRHPALLAVVEAVDAAPCLARRLTMALAIAEATPTYASHFIALRPTPRWLTVVRLVGLLCREAPYQLLRVAARKSTRQAADR